MPPKKTAAKAAATPATAADFKTGDVVLGKIKGYPDWPSKIMEHDTAPGAVAKVKGNRSILLRFFPDGDYMWAVPKEVKLLTTKDIDAFLSDTSKKNGKLKTAYTIAKDPSEWEAEQEKKANDVDEEEDEDEEEDVDMLAEDGEQKPTKKRKRAAPAEKKEKKEKKEPASKAKKETAAAAKKRKTEESAAEKKPKSAPKGKAAPKDKKEAAKKDGAAADETSEGAKTVKGWRASLQKGFLTKGVPAGDKMPEYDSMFKAMEGFEMQAEWLAMSKLGKVLKKMSVLEGIEREEEFKLKERCNSLMDKWKEMLNKEGGDDVPAVAAAGGTEQVAGTGAATDGNAGDLTMMDATEESDKKEGVNAEGQTNGVPEEDKKTEETAAAPAVETNGSA